MQVIDNLKNKINFIDERENKTIIIGYDTEQQCCENFGYFFHTSLFENTKKDINELEKHLNRKLLLFNKKDYPLDLYHIDENFFKKLTIDNDINLVIFKLYNSNKIDQNLYLYLFNITQYYHHGFTVSINNEVKIKDLL